MTPEEITAAIQPAENGVNKILEIAKRNINNQTALLVRKVFGNRYPDPTAAGRTLTTQSFSPAKQRDLVFHKLVVIGPEGGVAIDANEAFNAQTALGCYTKVLNDAQTRLETLRSEHA